MKGNENLMGVIFIAFVIVLSLAMTMHGVNSGQKYAAESLCYPEKVVDRTFNYLEAPRNTLVIECASSKIYLNPNKEMVKVAK